VKGVASTCYFLITFSYYIYPCYSGNRTTLTNWPWCAKRISLLIFHTHEINDLLLYLLCLQAFQLIPPLLELPTRRNILHFGSAYYLILFEPTLLSERDKDSVLLPSPSSIKKIIQIASAIACAFKEIIFHVWRKINPFVCKNFRSCLLDSLLFTSFPK